jgi:DNA-binding response OmpR family regulator
VHVVVVDDEVRLVELICGYLEEVGFVTTACHDGVQALAAAHEIEADAMVLDLMMPGLSGLEVTRTLRREGLDLPILMLTARGAVAERVAGLEAGADDYLVKPFAMEELAARLRALGRRLEPSGARIHLGNVVLDPGQLRVWVGQDEVDVPRREFAMLEELMRHPGRVISRQRLFDVVWEGEVDIRSNALEVHVSRLRSRLAAGEGVAISTVRGRGYRIEATRTQTP